MSDASVKRGGLSGPFGERLTVAVLVFLAAFLAYVRFVILPSQLEGEPIVFHFENPMLEAMPGDCVRGKGSDDPGNERCFVVVRRVERPAKGPNHLAGHLDLQQTRPYLVVRLHNAGAGEGRGGCGGADDGPEILNLYPLNDFGMVSGSQVVVDSIRPLWKRWGGREHFVYQVVMRRFDIKGTWVMSLSKDAPVTGAVATEIYGDERNPEHAFFREVPDCPRPKKK